MPGMGPLGFFLLWRYSKPVSSCLVVPCTLFKNLLQVEIGYVRFS